MNVPNQAYDGTMQQGHRATKTFEVLNGLRGIAAIAVATMHFFYYTVPLHPAIVAPAVDFFFVLSGFVIAHTYGDQLAGSLGVGRFMLARLIRFYPLYLLGLTMGMVAMATYQWLPDSQFYSQLAFALVMLPGPVAFDHTNSDLFPLNFPCWSLFFELIANFAYATLAPRLSNRTLGAIIVLGFLGLVASGLVTCSLDNGTVRPTFLGGLARVTFGFFAGVALYRRWRVRPSRFALPPLLLFVLLLLPLCFKPEPPIGWLYELVVVTLYLPGIVWLGAGSTARRGWLSLCIALGALSYPLYVIHAPVWTAVRAWDDKQFNEVLHDYAPWSGYLLIAGLCLVCWWLDKAVDYPLRRRLSRALIHRSTRAADPRVADVRR